MASVGTLLKPARFRVFFGLPAPPTMAKKAASSIAKSGAGRLT